MQAPIVLYAAELAPLLEAYLPAEDCVVLATLHSGLGVFLDEKRRSIEAELKDQALRLFRCMITPHTFNKVSHSCWCKECLESRMKQAKASGYTGRGRYRRFGSFFMSEFTNGSISDQVICGNTIEFRPSSDNSPYYQFTWSAMVKKNQTIQAYAHGGWPDTWTAIIQAAADQAVQGALA